MKENNLQIIPEEAIINKVFIIRGVKVMVDSDLAILYEIPTKRLKEQVKRNIKRFPKHFMFELTKEEQNELVANCDQFKKLKHSSALSYVFTQYGILQVANVLNSERAILMSNRIIEVFIKMHDMLHAHKDILLKLEQIEQQTNENSEEIKIIFDALKQLLNPPQKERNPVGYKIPSKEK
jgi:hypothetical protein